MKTQCAAETLRLPSLLHRARCNTTTYQAERSASTWCGRFTSPCHSARLPGRRDQTGLPRVTRVTAADVGHQHAEACMLRRQASKDRLDPRQARKLPDPM